MGLLHSNLGDEICKNFLSCQRKIDLEESRKQGQEGQCPGQAGSAQVRVLAKRSPIVYGLGSYNKLTFGAGTRLAVHSCKYDYANE